MNVLRGSIPNVVGIISLLGLFAGCASVPTAGSSADAEAKKFQPEPGTASVYLSRSAAGIGDTLVAETRVDGLMIGAVAPDTYLLVSVRPGHHMLTVTGPTNSEQLPVDLTAGSVYFYDVSVRWAGPGVRHRHIEAMSDADGRKAVQAETRAETTTNPS